MPSYADALSGGAAASEPPFFFTNGATDEPAAQTPDFFFTNGSPDAAAAVSAGDYLAALGGGATAPTGAGMASYLDSLPQNVAPSNAGSGMASYANALGGGAPPAAAAAVAAPAAAAAPVAAAPYVVSDEPSGPIAPGNYMASLAATSGAPTGTGLPSYLDVLPRADTAMGGPGIPSYTAALPTIATAAGTGVATYTDNLSGGRASSGKSFSPFSSKGAAPAPAFGMAASTGRFEFEIHADADMLAQIEAAQGRTVRLSGSASVN
jgi:hypothetical protein